MFIQTEETPNPLTMKFLPEIDIMGRGDTRFYTNKKDAEESPLATDLFAINGISAVFLGTNFITITRNDNFSWSLIKADILARIMDFFSSGQNVINITNQSAKNDASPLENANDDEIVTRIKEILETRIRPAVAQDGGDIIFHSYDDGIVKLEMRGACSGCPSSAFTLKQGVENLLKHLIPDIISVEAA